MKTIPEQSTTHLINSSHQGIKLDAGALCFFLLGMFLAAFISHYLGLF